MASSVQPAVSAGERSVAIGAPVRGAMIVTGDNNTVEMRLGPVGAVLAFAFRWDRPRRRRRRERRHPSPPRFDNHVDRDEQVAALLPVDGSPRLVNVYGAAGIGKTHVLVGALNRSESEMRDGTIYLDGRGQSDDDLLHAVFDELFECRVQRRDLRIERLLSGCRAVVALEDVDLPPAEAQRLVLGAPGCRFLVTSASRVLFDATPVGLQGLTPEYAAVIAEQELGRSLAPEERRAAEMIAMRLDGHPLALRQAFSRARDEGHGRPLNELEALLGTSGTPADRLATLTRAQLGAARALAVHGDAPLGDEHLLAIAGAGAVQAARELEARHDATSYSPRHSLVGILARTLPQADLSEETDRALEHFTGWTEAHAGDTEALLREAAALLALLERAHAAERWPDVIRLGRAIESAYALGQRWADWGRVLELVLDAARRTEDLEAEGWARHQLGTRSYGLGQIDAARGALLEALALRERIGDSPGAAATRQNLRVVSGPAPLLYRLSHVSLTVVAIICTLLIGAAGVAGAGIIPGGGAGVMALSIGVQGDGRVVSDDGAIRCGSRQCSHEVSSDTELVLHARPQRGWEFAGWSDACSGRSSCRLVVTGDTRVHALFKRVHEPRDVTVRVDGEGTVVSHPAGIACHADEQCQATFTRSRTVTMTAAAEPGHRFAGWSRDCEGTKRCTIAAGGRRTVVQARFVTDAKAVALTVDLGGDGLGRVTSRQSGIDCGELCASSFPRDTRVVLSASAQPGSSFAGWSDPACMTATRSSCTVALDRSRNVSARFARTVAAPGGGDPVVTGSGHGEPGSPKTGTSTHELTVTVAGQGTVGSDPAGISDCSKQCSAKFSEGRRVVLTAAPAKGSTFTGWTDAACTNNTQDTCTVTLDRSRDVFARFDTAAQRPEARPPYVRIDSPADGSKFSSREKIHYSATVDDPQDGKLPDDAIVWREDGKIIGHGPQITQARTASGTHKIEVTATNSEHLSATKGISITVAPNAPPQVHIVEPKDNAEVEAGSYANVQFTATADDADGDTLTFTWTDSVDGAEPKVVSTMLSPKLELSAHCGRTSHALKLTVWDGTDTTPATVRVVLVAFSCVH